MSEIKRLRGLSFLITLHKFFGISYCGYGLGKRSLFSTIIAIVWNLVLSLGLLIQIYFMNIQSRIDKKFPFNKKSIGVEIIIRFAFIGVFSLTWTLNLILIFKGIKILKAFEESEIKISSNEEEKRIGIKIALIQGSYILVSLIIHLIFSYCGNDLNLTIFSFYCLFENIFMTASQTTTIALIAYFSQMICYHLNNMRENISVQHLDNYYYRIIQLNRKVKCFDKHFSIAIFISIVLCVHVQITTICFLVIDFNNSYWRTFPMFIFISILLVCLCFVCNIIPKSLSKLNHCLKLCLVNEQSFIKNLPDTNKTQILRLIQSISDEQKETYLTAFGLFKVRASTLLSVLSISMTYSVILIQTS